MYHYTKVRTAPNLTTRLTLKESEGTIFYFERTHTGWKLNKRKTDKSIKELEVIGDKSKFENYRRYVNVHKLLPNGLFAVKKNKSGYTITWQDRPKNEELRYDRHEQNRIALNGIIRLNHEARDIFFGDNCREYRTKYTCDIRNGFSLTLETVNEEEYKYLPRPATLQKEFGPKHLLKLGIETYAIPSSDVMYQFKAPATFVKLLGKEINHLKFVVEPGKLVITREDYICPVCGETEEWVDNKPDVLHVCPCCAKRIKDASKLAASSGLTGNAAIDYVVDWAKEENRLKDVAMKRMAELEAELNAALS